MLESYLESFKARNREQYVHEYRKLESYLESFKGIFWLKLRCQIFWLESYLESFKGNRPRKRGLRYH